ncbi:putative Dihydrolipoyllysine-residue succinyltransferase [Chytriomyces cf. hyalinus JEL632]|nr:putative Dihydrolipoyllysine-residue succinyltransferase [Chytriomyces cf. hyalinus JEL632]
MADSITEGTLTKWHKFNSAESGTVLEYFAKEGETVMVGSNLFKVDVDGVAGTVSKPGSGSVPPATSAAAPATASAPVGDVKLVIVKTPPMADSITEGTLTKWHKSVGEYVARDEPIATIETDKVDVTVNSAESGIIMEAFAKEGETVSVGSNLFKVDVNGNLIEFRSKYKEAVLDKHGVKLGFMDAFIKADFVDISVAVATPKGLVTPVVRNCEGMSILDCEKELAALGAKAKANEITIEDLAGGTFTISNGGVFGSLYGTPVINQPQSAILGMHATKDRAVVVNGQVVVRPMMYVALTYDHRLIDGREAVTFLVRVKELIEDPRRLLLEI